jgi:hypothetical protein
MIKSEYLSIVSISINAACQYYACERTIVSFLFLSARVLYLNVACVNVMINGSQVLGLSGSQALRLRRARLPSTK